jgi:hypothetical protein
VLTGNDPTGSSFGERISDSSTACHETVAAGRPLHMSPPGRPKGESLARSDKVA